MSFGCSIKSECLSLLVCIAGVVGGWVRGVGGLCFSSLHSGTHCLIIRLQARRTQTQPLSRTRGEKKNSISVAKMGAVCLLTDSILHPQIYASIPLLLLGIFVVIVLISSLLLSCVDST